MKSFTELIDKESEMALQELAHSQVQFLYSPSADIAYGSSLITVQNISIQIGPKRFVIIENDWADTPNEWHDYYILKIRISDQPKDIKVKESENGKNWTYVMDHLSFHIGRLEKVTSVLLIEDRYSGEQESVQYDAGIVIVFDNDKRLSIVREQSIAGFLEIAFMPKEVKDSIAGLKQGVVYSA